MEININSAYYVSCNIQENTFESNKGLKSDKDTIQDNVVQKQANIEQKTDKVKNFASLCKKFPDIAFVVIDNNIGNCPLPEYNGICNTAAFGDLDKVSIQIQEEVIEKLDKDFDNIIKMIQYISDNYTNVKNNAVLSGCKHADAVLHYNGADLSYMQTLYVTGPPVILRETGFLKPNSYDNTNNDTKEKYFQTFLLNIQYNSYNKLFEIGEKEDEKKYTVKSEQKCAENYQKHFLYKQEVSLHEN